ncbi:hypothetical protein PQ465_09880 [Sphingobacterium oryzagri]|uniref:Outer membrane protein beta-barrel domain-containing protein n=1 Tax=Sphingobacterium oryzagri TaxID=3025669 RepID=A0ABY7WNQ5_9SPHI|nr:hypothetical protein [Sphingobacterium sp. KACC 22765]WDF70665.1 hypothetical protein PQ465_09880 [Sphingobacterium sp. KACC 22765]
MQLRTIFTYGLGIGLFFLVSTAKGQLNCPPTGKIENNGRFNITLGTGPTLLFSDINNGRNMGVAGVLKVEYQIYKGIFAGLEAQVGVLNSYGKNYDNESLAIDYVNRDPRFVKNYMLSGNVNVTVYPGLFFVDESRDFRTPSISSLIGRGLYLGFAFGGIINQYDELYRDFDNPYTDGEFERDQNGELRYRTPTRDYLWPIANVGLALPLNKYSSYSGRYWSLVFNIQQAFSTGDQLDGYRTGRTTEGSYSKDSYNFSYLALKYTF